MSGDGPTSEDYNRFSGDPRQRPKPTQPSLPVDFNESRAHSNYHGMSAQLQRRYSCVAFQAAYTLWPKDVPSSAMDIGHLDSTTATPATMSATSWQ